MLMAKKHTHNINNNITYNIKHTSAEIVFNMTTIIETLANEGTTIYSARDMETLMGP